MSWDAFICLTQPGNHEWDVRLDFISSILEFGGGTRVFLLNGKYEDVTESLDYVRRLMIDASLMHAGEEIRGDQEAPSLRSPSEEGLLEGEGSQDQQCREAGGT